MSDLKDLQDKDQAALVAGTHEQGRGWHLHVDAAGKPRWHVHSCTTETPAQRDFHQALERFLQRWEARQNGEVLTW